MGDGGGEQAANNSARQPVSHVVDPTGCFAGEVMDYSILM
jgi:hypothetical protein